MNAAAAFMNDTPTPVMAMASTGNGSDPDAAVIEDEYGWSTNVPQSEIKNEPPEDIDDSHGGGGVGVGGGEQHNSIGASPKIRLTPTIKLMAAGGGVAADVKVGAKSTSPNLLLETPPDPRRKFVCHYDSCTKSYGKSSHLRSHLTWHTGIKPFVCLEPFCGKGFTRSDELNRHVRTHTGEKPFECMQCTKKFSRSDHLTKHLATHVKQMLSGANPPRRNRSDAIADRSVGPASASNASESGTSSPAGRKRTYVEMKRPANHMQFADGMHFMAALIESSNASAGKDNAMENLTDEAPTFEHNPLRIKLERPDDGRGDYHAVSPQAEQLQQSLPILPHHITACESEDEMMSPPELIVPVSTMICPPSPKEIKSEPNDDAIMPEANGPPLNRHRQATLNTQQQQQGGATTTTDATAAVAAYNGPHITAEVKYDPERPFNCTQCSKCFKRQDDLNRHARTHTGEKPFACGECERRFMRSDHLKKHLRTHTKVQRMKTTMPGFEGVLVGGGGVGLVGGVTADVKGLVGGGGGGEGMVDALGSVDRSFSS